MRQQLRFRDLEYLVAIADRRSFAKAADALGVSQPTLSNQVRRIEDAMECRLFDRAGRRVAVTPEGARVLEHVREILSGFYALDRAVRGEEDFVGRRLRLGAISTVAPYLGPPLLAQLRRENPEGAVRFVEGLTDELEAQVAAGELDAAITATLPRVAGLRARRVAREALIYVSAEPLPGDPLAPDAPARPVLLMQEGHCFRDVVYEAVARLNAQRLDGGADAVSPASLSTLVALVRAGAGDAVLPAPVAMELGPLLAGLEVRPLAPERFQRTLQLVVRAGREDHVDMARLAAIGAQAHAAAARAGVASGPGSSKPDAA